MHSNHLKRLGKNTRTLQIYFLKSESYDFNNITRLEAVTIVKEIHSVQLSISRRNDREDERPF